jgi:hypothetical protein
MLGLDYNRDGLRPLPVLRVRYADPDSTWLYLDPQLGTLTKQDRGGRWNRWLYHGLHNLDFPFLYYRRPLWDITLIVLSIGGVVLSATTLVPSWHRLVRHARRAGKAATSRSCVRWRTSQYQRRAQRAEVPCESEARRVCSGRHRSPTSLTPAPEEFMLLRSPEIEREGNKQTS